MARPFALIIEDQRTLAMLFEDALRLVAYDVKAIHDGLDALNYLELNDAPNMIILDINLPSLSGRDIHKYIRSTDKFKDIPVLILTANSLMMDTLRPELEENDYMALKPIGMKKLQDLAKAMRPTKEGKTEYMAKTQPIPDLSMIPLNDDSQTDKQTVKITDKQTVLTDDKQSETTADTQTVLTDDKQSEVISSIIDPKADTQEHQAIITDDENTKSDKN